MHNHEVETSCLPQEPISWEKVHYKLVIKVKSSVTKLTIAAQFTIKQFVVCPKYVVKVKGSCVLFCLVPPTRTHRIMI